MVRRKMMQEIQDLKAKGFSMNEISEHLGNKCSKSPAKRTIRKYCNTDGVPDNPGAALEKDKAFAKEPFHGTIPKIMEAYLTVTASAPSTTS